MVFYSCRVDDGKQTTFCMASPPTGKLPGQNAGGKARSESKHKANGTTSNKLGVSMATNHTPVTGLVVLHTRYILAVGPA